VLRARSSAGEFDLSSTAKQFAGCFAPPTEAERCRVAFVGLPCDSQSSYRRGCALGPQRIRMAYDSDCYNSTTELGADLAGQVADYGDLGPARTWRATAQRYQAAAEKLLEAGKTPFFAGGDHAVTIPLARALRVLHRPVHVIQFDAHPDLYPVFAGDRESHACVAARMLEMPHIASVTQIGIRTLNAPQQAVARSPARRLRILPARDAAAALPPLRHIPRHASVYITLDLDVFDPGFAPGVSHPVPGGLAPRQVLNFLQRLPWRLAGMDVVELNPRHDVHDLTAVLAGRLLHEAMGAVRRR
jgi:agmatinase